MGGGSASLLSARNWARYLLAGMALAFSCNSSSLKCRDAPLCRPVSQKWHMNPESHIKGTEMAQGCHFAFSVQDWSQHTSLQESGHNCMSQTRPFASKARNLESATAWFAPWMEAPRSGRLRLDPAACTFCWLSGGVQLCGVCVVSPAQGNSPLRNQTQM